MTSWRLETMMRPVMLQDLRARIRQLAQGPLSAAICATLCQEVESEAAPLADALYDGRRPAALPYDRQVVNASLLSPVEGYGRRYFIAAEGPRPATAPEFLQMLIQQQIGLVLVLESSESRPEEPSCLQYWPRDVGDSLEFGGVTVQLYSETHRSGCAERRLRLRYGQSEQLLTQVQVCGWPQRGLPTCRQFDIFLQAAGVAMSRLGWRRRVAVHCRDGVGRTGVFMAVHRLLQFAATAEVLLFDIVGVVRRLMHQRAGMVAQSEQLLFVYQYLEHYAITRQPEMMKFLYTQSDTDRRAGNFFLLS